MSMSYSVYEYTIFFPAAANVENIVIHTQNFEGYCFGQITLNILYIDSVKA